MLQKAVYTFINIVLVSVALSIAGCGDDKSQGTGSETRAEKTDMSTDAVARVGDEVITYSQLNSLISSSAMVGISVPEIGTPERKQFMLGLLDNIISANLIYLDARAKGIDRLTSYTEDVSRFEDAILASMYKSAVMVGDVKVSESEVLHYYNTRTSKEAELDDTMKMTIEAMIRQKKLDELKATMRDRLRENVDVVVNEKVLSVDHDKQRSDAEVVATYNKHRISWSQVKDLMRVDGQNSMMSAYYIESDSERRNRLEQYIDNAIMTMKGRAAEMDKDPDYLRHTAEYRKARLINEHRNGLIHSWNPSDDELKTFYVDNMDSFVVPEKRKVQMVVVKTREEAEEIKQQIDANEITMYQAAQQYSTDPELKRTLGDMGWVSRGAGFEGLDDFIFSLEPEVISGPVESPAGWHLVKVLDVIDGQHENIDEPRTRQLVFKAYMKRKFDDYVDDLRENHFKVVVYNDEINRQFQNEADFIAEQNRKAEEAGSITRQHTDTEELQQLIKTPPTE
ncbi:MAG: peptidylprolyl isomerase [Gammaproteobacteria bacterium]|jgi:parvulin-like peptidyl-prolyl isomerase